MSRLYASVVPSYVEVPVGEEVVLELTVGNLSAVIDGYSVRIFGLDAEWLTLEPARLSLFPGDSAIVALRIRLPHGFPAGYRQVSVHVQSENDSAAFELATVTLNVSSMPQLRLTVDPASVTGGSKAQYGLVVVNKGNSIVDVVPDAVDPEDTAEITFEPSFTHLLPGEQVVMRASVNAPRPWVGQPIVRVLTFAVRGPEPVESMATFVQRPRISRWVLSLLGLVTAAAVFAAVLSRTLSNVVDEAKVSDEVVNEALADEEAAGERVSLNPSTVTGKLVSATTGAGIAGVQAQLYRATDGNVAIASAATGDDGAYAFGRLSAGTFRIKFSGAGFADTWYTAGRTFAEATDVEVPPDDGVDLGEVQLGGRPGSVSGKVIAPDVTGATIRLVVPGINDPGTPAIVASVDVSADGTFSLENIPSPASYQLVVERPGNAAETQEVVLGPAQVIDDLEIRLRGGDGRIGGRVLVGGQPLGGVDVEATDGTDTITTVSLTDGDVGAFALRGLATPGRYTLTISRDGYSSESRTVALAQGETVSLDISLRAARGSIGGRVNDSTGAPLGGVSVTVTGGEEPVLTSTISQGDATGSWTVDELETPGTYTITFSKPGYVDQTRLVTIDGSAAGGVTSGIDAALVPDSAMITGQVLDAGSNPLPLAGVELTDGVTTRDIVTSHDPPGRFALTSVPPGSYTLTVTFTGATPVVQVVTVQAGETRDVQLQLGRQAAIGGRVVNPDGSAFTSGEVRLFVPTAFPGGQHEAVAAIQPDGTYSFTGITAPSDYVVAVYSSSSAVDALDSELTASVPGEVVEIPDLVVVVPQ